MTFLAIQVQYLSIYLYIYLSTPDQMLGIWVVTSYVRKRWRKHTNFSSELQKIKLLRSGKVIDKRPASIL